MYFRLANKQKKKWNEKDEDWHKPNCKKVTFAINVENFSSMLSNESGSFNYLVIAIILFFIAGLLYFLYKKKTSS